MPNREGGAKLRIRRHAADDRDGVGSGRLDPLDESTDDGALVARGQVRPARLELGGPEVAYRVEQGRLQAGEREVQAGDARDRERICLRVSVAGEPVDLGSARIPEAEQPGALVERLAGRVV